jgi:hypothetical protein
MLCSRGKSDKMSEDGISIRVSQQDYDWLMQNRGAGSVKQKVHELIEYYQYNKKMAL